MDTQSFEAGQYTQAVASLMRIDPLYLPDDAIAPMSIPSYYDVEESFTYHLNRLVFRNIRDQEIVEEAKPHKQKFLTWRNGKLKNIGGVLESLFPNRWEIQQQSSDTYDDPDTSGLLIATDGNPAKMRVNPITSVLAYQLYIHFPEIVITNSSNSVWTIKDYYVIIGLNRILGVKSIQGFRATKTVAEHSLHYTHSHSHTAELDYVSFCFGHTALDTLVAELYLGDYQEIQFELFLQNLTDYLSWESKEGVPYVSIDDVILRRRGDGACSLNIPTDVVISIADNICKNRDHIDVDIWVSRVGVVDVALHTTKTLVEVVTKYCSSDLMFPLDEVAMRSIYPSQPVSSRRLADINSVYAGASMFEFKGKAVTLHIIEDEKDKEDEKEILMYADMRLVKTVATLLRDRLIIFINDYVWSGTKKRGLPKT